MQRISGCKNRMTRTGPDEKTAAKIKDMLEKSRKNRKSRKDEGQEDKAEK